MTRNFAAETFDRSQRVLNGRWVDILAANDEHIINSGRTTR